jgi:1,4-dihydroxy-2-naphthoate octaprenyltransferase
MASPASFKVWVLAARPKTLAAAAVPVLLGGALAAANGSFVAMAFWVCMGFALLIQVGTNYANDYYDHRSGADGEDRKGPARAVAQGWVTAAAMWRATALVFGLALAIGLLLVGYGGWWLVAVGLICVACGYAYTGGPYPLGYNGWGDVFVMVFFGWVATAMTYFVQAGDFAPGLGDGGGAWVLVLAGVVPGCLATNLLVVNNLRDRVTDARVGKRTLVVRFGAGFGRIEYAVCLGSALLIPLIMALYFGDPWLGLPLLGMPLAVRAWLAVVRGEWDAALRLSALCLVVTGVLFASGVLLAGAGQLH